MNLFMTISTSITKKSKTSKELIKIESIKIGSELTQTVDARKLHKTLGSKRQFTDWIKTQLQEDYFLINRDYVILEDKNGNFEVTKNTPLEECKMPHVNVRQKLGGNIKNDYFLSLNTATHIAMMSRCDMGMKLRQYFIDVEKAYKQLPQIRAYNKADIQTIIEREKGKEERRELTDAVQKLDKYFHESGSENGKFMYATITKLIYKELFNISVSLKRLKGIRDYLDVRQLRKLSTAEMLVAETIDNKIEARVFYSDIYPSIRDVIQRLTEVLGVTEVPLMLTTEAANG